MKRAEKEYIQTRFWLTIGLPVMFRYRDRKKHHDAWMKWWGKPTNLNEPFFKKLFDELK